MRPFGSQTTPEDIENEINAIEKLEGIGSHRNIVDILGHGKLGTSGYYFIDMELCDLDLKDYIHGERSIGNDNAITQDSTNVVFVSKDCGLQLKLQNAFTILSHITDGLEFAHEHKLVHRDLKPGNGNSVLLSNNNLFSPLLSQKEFMDDCRFWVHFSGTIKQSSVVNPSPRNTWLPRTRID